jgi:hypothetical protein
MALIALLFSALTFEQDPITCDSAVSMMRSTEWKTRSKGFEEGKRCLSQQNIKDAVIELLELENRVTFLSDEELAKPDFQPLGESHSEYYYSLIQCVVSFGSEQGARALAKGGGNALIARKEVLKWPHAVIPILTEQILNSRSFEQRDGSILQLKEILESNESRSALRREEIELVRDGLHSALADKSWVIRRSAIGAVVALQDRSTIPWLKSVEQQDVDARVRDAARESLKTLQKSVTDK